MPLSIRTKQYYKTLTRKNMGFKDFFILPDENQAKTKVEEKPVVNSKFPTEATNKFPSTSQNSFANTAQNNFRNENVPQPASSVNPFLDKITNVYNEGFNKLNKPGYDFFEFYKSILIGGVDNYQAYNMALEMGRVMDPNVSKETLSEQADYYIAELGKVYEGFKTDGQNKLSNSLSDKTAETNSLTSEIESLKQQLSAIQFQINDKQTSLGKIDAKYQSTIDDINFKLSANDTVSNNLISSIQKVKSNILNILK